MRYAQDFMGECIGTYKRHLLLVNRSVESDKIKSIVFCTCAFY